MQKLKPVKQKWLNADYMYKHVLLLEINLTIFYNNYTISLSLVALHILDKFRVSQFKLSQQAIAKFAEKSLHLLQKSES